MTAWIIGVPLLSHIKHLVPHKAIITKHLAQLISLFSIGIQT